MTLDELKQRTKELCAPYRSDREKRAKRLFIEERAAALKDDREREFAIKTKIATVMAIPYSSVSFTGSAQLGFSAHQDTLFEPAVSDLDVACIDMDLFQRAWVDLNRTTRAFSDLSKFGRMRSEDISIFMDQILKRGMIRVEIMPQTGLTASWKRLESDLSRVNAALFKKVSIAIYMNEYAFCWKQDSSLASLDAVG